MLFESPSRSASLSERPSPLYFYIYTQLLPDIIATSMVCELNFHVSLFAVFFLS